MKHKLQRHFTMTFLLSITMFGILLAAIVLASLMVYALVECQLIPYDVQKASIGLPLLYLACISVIVAAILTFLIAHMPSHPINQLISGMNQLAQGDFSVRLHFKIDPPKHSGLEKVANSFNTMAAELEQTELLRSDFINNFSHEFKTPIVSIAGFASLLRKGQVSKLQQQEYLQIIEEESLRLSFLATNVLELTRLENQQILNEVSTFNIAEQVRSCIVELDGQWQKKDLSFSLDLEEVCLEANEEMMRQVWINLLSNAIKFCDKGSTIEIKLKKEGSQLHACMANQGKTIEPENLGRIFSKFFQEERSHAHEGSGLGLAIVRRIIELHEGSIEVQSQNHQTAFFIHLPIQKRTA